MVAAAARRNAERRSRFLDESKERLIRMSFCSPTPGFWKQRRVCVTGGTGFLGLHLVRALLEVGANVRVLALPPSGRQSPAGDLNVEHFFGDVRDADVAAKALADCDVVFHTAGVVAVWGDAIPRMHSVHAEGTQTVLRAAPAGARIVHTSSIVAVGAALNGAPAREEGPTAPPDEHLHYAVAKRVSERIALDAARVGRDVVVTNPGYLLGPEDHEPSVMGRLCIRFWKGRLPMQMPGGFNLVDVRDAAVGHLLAAEYGLSGRRYILGGENHFLTQFFTLLEETAGWRTRFGVKPPSWTLTMIAALAEFRAKIVHKEPYPAFQHVRLNRQLWFADSTRAQTELGYSFRSIRESLKETYQWHRAKGLGEPRGLNGWLVQRPRRAA
jgi:dihydroflavonol-4-reductase